MHLRLFKFYIAVLLFSIALFFSSCNHSNKHQIVPAFYHWQSQLNLSPEETSYLQKLHVQKLYLKFFDVDWDATSKQIIPLAILDVKSKPDSVEIIPTIFITNRTLLNIGENEIDSLSNHITKKINAIAGKANITFNELQFDCDWTEKTREKYFRLINLVHKNYTQNNFSISATIRLHQIKYYKQTGVPPVNKGMLMFYNTGDVDDVNTSNSILDLETAKKYLVNFDEYTLPLDVVLPVFSWGVLYRRGKLIQLLNNTSANDFADTSRFISLENNKYRVVKSTYYNGTYLYSNDVIRIESVSNNTLEQAADLLSKQIKNKNITVAFYHLHPSIFKKYTYEELEKALTHF